MERKCLSCETEIGGRKDRKFCSDYCRNNYNNVLNADANKFVRNINNILRKNRRVLEALNPGETSLTTREELYINGFNFNYFTNTYTTKAGKVYYFCYDQGYLELENDSFALVRRKEYVK